MTIQELLDLPSNHYDLIVVDPPWPIKKLRHKARPNQIKMDYPIMSLDNIFGLPIHRLATEKSLCFLWTTQKFLYEARSVLDVWNFKFLLTMVWEKTYGKSAGMPLYGFRWNAEFILVGYTKKPELWPKRPLIPCVFQAPNIRHSQKPDKFYDLIAPLGTSRIDIFARRQREGWDVWGNEV